MGLEHKIVAVGNLTFDNNDILASINVSQFQSSTCIWNFKKVIVKNVKYNEYM